MMKNKLFFLLLTALLPITTVHAYRIYNQTSVLLHVFDTRGFRGMNTNVKPGESAACNPSSGGCSGLIHFHITSGQGLNARRSCTWSGKIDDSRGHYFVITNSLDNSQCVVNHYHD